MDPAAAYEILMGTVRARLLIHDVDVNEEGVLYRAERFALHVRKSVEAVSFAALSATESKNTSQLLQQRTKGASQVLTWLDQKKLLRLPESQRVTPSFDPRYGAVCEGNPPANIGVAELQGMFSRASVLVHERHPERLSQERLSRENCRRSRKMHGAFAIGCGATSHFLMEVASWCKRECSVPRVSCRC
jgi:hypothetical protein